MTCGPRAAGAGTVVVVSPHLDDAALCVGALLADLAAAGSRIEVHTLFAGRPTGVLSDVARAFHRDCDLGDDAVAVRRREDAAAMSHLGVAARHWDFGDAIYRRREDGRWLCEHDRAMFEDDPGAEPRLADAVQRVVAAVCVRASPDLVLVSAADAGHTDHRIARDAALAAAGTLSVPALLWEDLPYAVGRPAATGMGRPAAYGASPEAWRLKWLAISAYPSQTRMLWPAGARWRDLLHDHAVERGRGRPAELLWRPAGRAGAAAVR